MQRPKINNIRKLHIQKQPLLAGGCFLVRELGSRAALGDTSQQCLWFVRMWLTRFLHNKKSPTLGEQSSSLWWSCRVLPPGPLGALVFVYERRFVCLFDNARPIRNKPKIQPIVARYMSSPRAAATRRASNIAMTLRDALLPCTS